MINKTVAREPSLPIDLLIYDLDGTLVDSAEDIVLAVSHMLAKLNLPKRSPDEIRTFIGEGVHSLVARSLGEDAKTHHEEGLKFLKHYYSAHLLDHTRAYAGVLETLEHFKAKKQVVLTNKPEKYSREILKGLRMGHFFLQIVGGDSLYSKKPSPEGIFFFLNELKISANRAVMIGDSHIDIQAGQAAKIMTCGVAGGLGDQALLRASAPDFLIENFSGLSKIFN